MLADQSCASLMLRNHAAPCVLREKMTHVFSY